MLRLDRLDDSYGFRLEGTFAFWVWRPSGVLGRGLERRRLRLVDGELIAGVVIAAVQTRAGMRAGGWQTDAFTFVIDGSAPPETIAFVFDNDGVDPLALGNINFHIDAIKVDGVRFGAKTDGVMTCASRRAVISASTKSAPSQVMSAAPASQCSSSAGAAA